MRLTQDYIETLACPAGRRDTMVFDDRQAGLGVRVTASGRETFLVQYARAGARRRVPLGSCAAISPDDARDVVRKIMGEVARGRDPALEREQAATRDKRTTARDASTLDTRLD